MRSLFASAVAVLVMSAQVLASSRASDPTPQVVTLLMYVEAPELVSSESMNAMKQELRTTLNKPFLTFDFITPNQAQPPAYFQSLVSIRMTGACSVAGPNVLAGEGPLAFAHSSDGRILPFIEVECDRVRRHIRPAFWGPDFERPDYLYGRALARVIAHELYHVLTGRSQHTTGGLTRRALTGGQLICDEFPFRDETADLIADGVR